MRISSVGSTAFSQRFMRDRRGSVAIYFALALLPIIGMFGSAIDYGRAGKVRAQAQAAMDNATLTAASTSTKAAVNAFLGGLSNEGATITSGPTFTANADGSITGAASGQLPTQIMSVVGIQSMNFSVHATAKLTSQTVNTKTPNKVCILVLDPSASQALLVNGNFNVAAPNCEIDVASTGAPAAIFNSGDNINMQNVCIHGGNVIQNSVTVTNLSTGCAVAADPFKNALPAVASSTCTVSNQNYSGTVSLSPGVYCGGFNFNGSGSLNLQPGLYVLKGANWNLNSGWSISGTGVTFYFADSSSYVQLNSGVTASLAAPTSGTYANILVFEPAGLAASGFTINAGASQTLTGLIYLPSRNLIFNAGSNLSSESLTLVVNQLILNSNSPGTWNLAPGALSIGSASFSSASTTTRPGTPTLIR